MKMFTILLLGSFMAGQTWAESMTFERQLSISSEGVDALEIIAGQGSLTVIGTDSDTISVEAIVASKDYAEMAEFVEVFDTRMLFWLKQQGNLAQLMGKARKSMYNTPNIRVNMTVQIPKRLKLMIDDGSGALSVSDINGAVMIDDESGNVMVKRIHQAVTIKDGSGTVQVKDVMGDVILDDKSGMIQLKNITGKVTIEDGSGDIQVDLVNGDVFIDDGSGDIKVTNLEGRFQLLDDGSGSVEVNGEPWRFN